MSYNLKQDHENIKKQIKSWERKLDKIIDGGVIETRDTDRNPIVITVFDQLEEISHEMMAINI